MDVDGKKTMRDSGFGGTGRAGLRANERRRGSSSSGSTALRAKSRPLRWQPYRPSLVDIFNRSHHLSLSRAAASLVRGSARSSLSRHRPLPDRHVGAFAHTPHLPVGVHLFHIDDRLIGSVPGTRVICHSDSSVVVRPSCCRLRRRHQCQILMLPVFDMFDDRLDTR